MIKVIRREGERLPPFYYGMAYTDWQYNYDVYYWMPFCYIIQVYKLLRNKWYVVQGKRSPNDKIIMRLRSEAISRANEIFKSQAEEAERFRNAYYECLSAMIGSNVPKETIDRLHKL